jgi:hypothetical protein
MSSRRLVVHASHLRDQLEKLDPDGVVAIELLPATGGNDTAPFGPLLCLAAELRTPSLLVLTPFEMAPPERALFDAVQGNDLRGCVDALDAGASVDARDGRSPFCDFETPLMLAAGSPEIVRLLLERGGDPNARSGTGWTPLMRACNASCTESARLLLAAGADLSVVNNEGYNAYGRIPGTNTELLALLQAATEATG